MTKNKVTTTAAVQTSDANNLAPEFLRTPGVEKVFGLKRGTLYNLEAGGSIRGTLLRVRGQKSGVKLWSVDSIRKFIAGQAAR